MRMQKCYSLVICLSILCMLTSRSVGDVDLGPFESDADTHVLYHMDEGAGSAVADSGDLKRNATMSADLAAVPQAWGAGQAGFGSAVNFVMEVSKYKAIEYSGNSFMLNALDAFTIEAWIKPSNFGAYEYLCCIGGAPGTILSILWDYETAWNNSLGRLYIGTYSSGWKSAKIDITNVADQFKTGIWQHFGLIYKKTGTSGSRYEVYKNGVLVGSADVDYRITNDDVPRLTIGHYPSGVWYRQYEGMIDEFRISDYARDWSEVLPDPNTVGLFRFDTMRDDDDTPAGESVIEDADGLNLRRPTGEIWGRFRLNPDVPSIASEGSLAIDMFYGLADTAETGKYSIGATGELTIEFWYKPVAVTTLGYLLAQELDVTNDWKNGWILAQTFPDGSGNFGIEFYSVNNQGITGNAGLRNIVTPNLFNNSSPWSHIAVRISRGGMATIFVNGVAVVSKAGFTGFEPYASRLRIGASNTGDWRGQFMMDDLRISGRALRIGSGSGVGEMAWNASLSQGPNTGLRPPDLAKQWLRTHPFMISSWAATAGGEDMYLFTQANFNTSLSNRSGYQFLSAAGVDGHQIYAGVELDADTITTIHIAHNSPRMTGWLNVDETAPDDIEGVADVAEYIRTLDTSRIIYAGLGSSGEPYIDNVISTIQPDAVIHGWYWVVNPEILPGSDFYSAHFYELDINRRKAQEYGIPLFWYIQSFSDINSTEDPRNYRYLPSESQLRMDLFSSLAFGVKGVIYFLFDARQGGPTVLNALLDKNGNPSSLYEPAKQANKEISNVGKALRFLESTDVRFIKGQPSNPIPPSMTAWSPGAGGDTHIQSIQIVQQGTYKDGLIGFFTDDLGQKYFMLVNLYQGSDLNAAAATLNFNVTFDASVSNVWRLRRSDGTVESVAVPTHTLSLALPGGTGELFKYDNGNFQLSGCADINNPYPAGDLDGDCFVNLNDFAPLAQTWQDLCTSPGWCGSCDLNMDGEVELADLAIVAGNWLDCSDPFASCN